MGMLVLVTGHSVACTPRSGRGDMVEWWSVLDPCRAQVVGWYYVKAMMEREQYKEHKFILERSKVVHVYSSPALHDGVPFGSEHVFTSAGAELQLNVGQGGIFFDGGVRGCLDCTGAITRRHVAHSSRPTPTSQDAQELVAGMEERGE